MPQGLWIAIAIIAVLVIAALIFGLVRYRSRQVSLLPSSDTAIEAPTPVDRSGGYTASSGISFTQSSGPATVDRPRSGPAVDPGFGSGLPGVGDDAAIPRDSVKRPISNVGLPETSDIPLVEEVEEYLAETAATQTAPELDAIAPSAGRLERLRGRLAKSQNAFGRSMLGLLGGGDLDEDSWAEVEDTLLIADLGPVTTASVVEHLRAQLAASSVRSEAEARAVLREVLIRELNPALDRSIRALPHAEKPSVLLVVGVNGTGKTTTVGKLARVLVADLSLIHI